MLHRLAYCVSIVLFTLASGGPGLTAAFGQNPPAAKIVLVAGVIQQVDKTGHHDYTGGAALLAELLKQTPGVQTVVIRNGWPEDPAVFDGAASVVFYTDGGGKQAYLESDERIAAIQKLVDRGAGLVNLHQAVDYPKENAEQATGWIGGIYLPGVSGRGHWDSHHEQFPQHPVTRGVVPWKINDGWLNKIRFVEGLKGITPLVWSGQKHLGAPAGGEADICAWTFDRPQGGRSFCFTGLDAHSAWKLEGMRRLVVNGILWSAGLEIPEAGAPCSADDATINRHLTPRNDPKQRKPAA